MKKFFCVILAAVLAAGLLIGCGSEPAPKGSGLTAEEILSRFEKMLEPIADQFQMTRLAKVELEDGELCQPVIITDPLLGRNYHLRVFYHPESGAYTVTLTAEKATRAEMNFAVLACYLYESLNLPEIDKQAFYDHFSMLSEKPGGSMAVEGWDLLVVSTEDLLSFSALYKAE